MIRVSVMYPNQPSGRFDMDYYVQRHMPLVHELLDGYGLAKTAVDQGIGSNAPDAPAPYIAIGHLFFDSLENMQTGLARHDARLAADVPNFSNIRPQFQISRVMQAE